MFQILRYTIFRSLRIRKPYYCSPRKSYYVSLRKNVVVELQAMYYSVKRYMLFPRGSDDNLLGKLASSEGPNGKLFLPCNLKNKWPRKLSYASNWLSDYAAHYIEVIQYTVDSGNSKRLNSKPSLNSKRIFLVTPIVL